MRGNLAKTDVAPPVEHASADNAALELTAAPEKPAPPRGIQLVSSDYGSLPDPAPTPGAAVVPARGAAANDAAIAPVGAKNWTPGRTGNGQLKVDLEPVNPKTNVEAVGPVPAPTRVAAKLGGEEQDDTRESALVAALRSYLDKHPDKALGTLKQLDKFSQEMLICLLPLAVQLSEAKELSPQERALILEQLDSLMVPLRARAPLVIAKMCLCKSVDTFGVYEALPDDHVFQAGEQVLIYAEVQNFTSERKETRHGQPVFVTWLASSVTIRNEAHKAVWKQEFHRDSPDHSQTLRHDYFDHYRFCLPKLRPGLYKIEIQVEDVATGRPAKRSLDLRIGVVPDGL
jgi:hypothetical protein